MNSPKKNNALLKKVFKKWLILPLLALLTFGLTELLAANPKLAENVYSRGIYPVIAQFISKVSVLLPFSLDDIFYVLLILSALVLVLLVIFKKVTLKFSGKFTLNVLAAVYVLFYFLWGFNYFRSELNQRLSIAQQEAEAEAFLNVFAGLIKQTNKTYTTFDNFDKSQVDSLVEQSYKNLAAVLGLDYPTGIRKAKNITFGRFFAQAGISGYYGPFFNEVHINPFNLPVEYPFVLAHEKAHQFGITSEAEANFYAWLVCTQSHSEKLKYSANIVAVRYFAYQGFQLEGYNETVALLDSRVKKDLNRIREHWMQLRNEKIDRAASKVNDAYLKTNKVEKGILDYYGVVKYIMDFKMDTTFQEKWRLKLE